MFSKKDLTRLMVPLIIEQILAVAVGMIDVIMVAKVGETAVSGVSLVDSINILPVSYTHLDVYKRQSFDCAHPLSGSEDRAVVSGGG